MRDVKRKKSEKIKETGTLMDWEMDFLAEWTMRGNERGRQ